PWRSAGRGGAMPARPYSISQSSGAFFVLAAAADFARLLIVVVVPQPRHPLAALLAAERCVIEEVVSVHEENEAARICRVRVIDVLSVAQKHAQPRRLAPRGTFLLLRGKPVVVWSIVILRM